MNDQKTLIYAEHGRTICVPASATEAQINVLIEKLIADGYLTSNVFQIKEDTGGEPDCHAFLIDGAWSLTFPGLYPWMPKQSTSRSPYLEWRRNLARKESHRVDENNVQQGDQS